MIFNHKLDINKTHYYNYISIKLFKYIYYHYFASV